MKDGRTGYEIKAGAQMLAVRRARQEAHERVRRFRDYCQPGQRLLTYHDPAPLPVPVKRRAA